MSLHLTPGIGSRSLQILLKALGSPQAVLDAPAVSLQAHLSYEVIQRLKHGPAPELLDQVKAWIAVEGNHLITWSDPDYPQSLLQTVDPPPVLYFRGRKELLASPAIAIVGSRNASPQGIENAENFARTLADSGLTIISGLALGIDAAAHRGGIKGQARSLAVIGTGMDRVYPAAHHELAHQLAEKGGILSEFPLGTPPIAANFPRRNRLISGLARGCLVVEATLSSGSLITARFALEQGREVFALPGSIHSPFSKGCHKLIKEGAKLVESVQDILDELHWQQSSTIVNVSASADVSSEAAQLLTALGHDPASIDTLCERSKLSVERVLALLLELELANRVKKLPGGLYQQFNL